MVLRVLSEGPADRSGIKPIERVFSSGAFVRAYRRDIEGADLIFKVDGKRVRNRDEVEEEIRKVKKGSGVELSLRRGGMYGPERLVRVVPGWE
jgi:S1-C subfamily serine protease